MSANLHPALSPASKFRYLRSIFPSRLLSLGWTAVCSFVFLLLLSSAALANNLSISSVTLVEQDSSSDTIKVQFTISWDNSWKDSINNDAVWVFLKYSTDSGSTWSHATLYSSGTNPSSYSRGSGTLLDLIVPSDRKGCFIQRSGLSSGSVSTSSVKILWDYGQDGVSDANASASTTRINLFAVEMVYVPEGGFYVGDNADGATDTDANFEFGSGASEAPQISSEEGMTFTNSTNDVWYYNSDNGTDDEADGAYFTVTESFPKGFAAFYVMKYEITEGQWTEFFNTLTSAQKLNRDITGAAGKNSDDSVARNTVSWTGGTSASTTTRSNRACSYLNWMDICAYADWSGLRPMSEFEFEKVCRGPWSPVPNEYAWGSTTITQALAISGTETGSETITTTNANCNYNNSIFTGSGDGSNGALRAGIFATTATTIRESAGAGYYGAMELSGNLWERAVTVGNAYGRSFAGTHGDGTLTTTTSYEGNATNLDWPGIDLTSPARGVTGADGSGFRGGSWSDTATRRLRIANRESAGTTTTTRSNNYGGRLVRTAP